MVCQNDQIRTHGRYPCAPRHKENIAPSCFRHNRNHFVPPPRASALTAARFRWGSEISARAAGDLLDELGAPSLRVGVARGGRELQHLHSQNSVKYRSSYLSGCVQSQVCGGVVPCEEYSADQSRGPEGSTERFCNPTPTRSQPKEITQQNLSSESLASTAIASASPILRRSSGRQRPTRTLPSSRRSMLARHVAGCPAPLSQKGQSSRSSLLRS